MDEWTNERLVEKFPTLAVWSICPLGYALSVPMM